MKTGYLRPLLTETTMSLAKAGWYVLVAPKRKSKNELKKEIADKFKVQVMAIKTMVVKGKKRRSPGERKFRKLSDWKKVLIRVKEGQKIDAFDIGA